jgi:GAF domain-containing protein
VEGQGFVDPGAIERSLAALRAQPADRGLTDALQAVITASCRLFEASGAGFMMVDENSALSMVAATDEPGRLLEAHQEERGVGPCVDALTFDHIVSTDDLRTDERWPELVPELPDAGVRAVLGVPIRFGGVAVGSLNVYRDRPSSWSEAEKAALTDYGQLIENLLVAGFQAREREQLVEQLQHALDNRVVIERAVGVIMAREDVDAVAAFNRLRGMARSTGSKVAEIANRLLGEFPGSPDRRV